MIIASLAAIEWAGAVAGFAAPLTIGTFLQASAKARWGYAPWRCTMTELGAGGGALARRFRDTNIVVGGLLAVFAVGVPHALDLGWLVTAALLTAAVGSCVVGLTSPRRIGANDPGRRSTIHQGAGFAIVVTMLVVSIGTWFRESAADLRALHAIALPVASAVFVFFVLFVAFDRKKEMGETGRWVLPGLYERLVWVAGYSWVVTAAGSVWNVATATIALAVWLLLAAWALSRPARRLETVPFDLAECQQNTLFGFSAAQAGKVLVMRITEPVMFAEKLRALIENKTIQGIAPKKDEVVADPQITIGFTQGGLRHLGVPYRWNAAYLEEDAFAQGMADRAPLLGDVGPSAPQKWDPGWTCPEAHAVLVIQGRSDGSVEQGLNEWHKALQNTETLGGEITTRTDGSKEHFGFADGISQPWIDGVHTSPRPGSGKLDPYGNWRPIALGEFILGQVDETGDVFPVPDPVDVFNGGTFMVVRKLEQNVWAFENYVSQHAGRLSIETDQFKAWLVGRFADGTPLEPTAEPSRDDPLEAAERIRLNSFTYGADLEGARCPLGAHIRRANPRDALGFDTIPSNRRRIIRRGMPYGPAYDSKEPTKGSPSRGLLFIGLNARISEQFEFIQRQWFNDGRPFSLGSAPDLVAGAGHRWQPAVIRGTDPLVTGFHSFVQTRGGGYYFVPSLPGLLAICDRAAPRRRQETASAARDRPVSQTVGGGDGLGEQDTGASVFAG